MAIATTRQTIEVEWIVKLEGYKKAYAEANKLPPAQAKIAIDALDRQLKADEKAHKAKIAQIREEERKRKDAANAQKKAEDEARKAAEAGAKGLKDRAEGLKKIAAAFGGAAGDMASVAGDLGEGLAATVGPAGLAAAGIAATGYAAYKAHEAMTELLNTAVETLDQLEAMGQVDAIPQKSIDALRDWEDAARKSEIAGMKLKVTAAGSVAPAMTELTYVSLGASDVLSQISNKLSEVADKASTSIGPIDESGRATDALGRAAELAFPKITGTVRVLSALAAHGRDAADGLGATEDQLNALSAASQGWEGIMQGVVSTQTELAVANGKMTEGDAYLAQRTREINRAYAEKLALLNETKGVASEEAAALKQEREEALRTAVEYAELLDQQKKTTGSTVDLTNAKSRLAEVATWVTNANQSLLTEEQKLTSEHEARKATIEKLVTDGLMPRLEADQALDAIAKEYEKNLKAVNVQEEKRLATLLKQISTISDGGIYRTEIKSLDDVAAARARDLADFEQTIADKIAAGRALVESTPEGSDERAAAEAAWSEELLQIEEVRRAGIFGINQKWDGEERRLQEERWGTAQQNIALAAEVATAALSAIGDIAAENFDRAKEQFEEAKSNLEDLKDREIELKNRLKNADSEAAKARIRDRLQENKVAQELARKEMQEKRKAMRKAFIAEKLSAIATIGIQTAVAVMEAAPLVPLQIAMGVLGGIQAGIVAAKPMPQFHGGVAGLGMASAGLSMPAPVSAPYSPGPDEVPSMLLRGESVLDRRATQTVGPENIERLNRGQAPMQPAPNYLVIDGEALELLGEAATRSRAFQSRLPRRGAR